MLNGYTEGFSLFGGQMEDILVIIYLLYWYLLDQPRTEGMYSLIHKWTKLAPTIKGILIAENQAF